MAHESSEHAATDCGWLGQIQVEGLRAAGVLVERFIQLVDGEGAAPDRPGSRDAATPTADPQPASMAAILPWFELWRDLTERTTDMLQRMGAPGAGPAGDGVQMGIDGTLTPTRPLVVGLGAGGRGQGEMWLHNGTEIDHGELVPHCGPLSDAWGNTLDCDVEIDPPKIATLPSRSSRGFVITVGACHEPPPGRYRGVVQVRGAEAVWMPIEVAVGARSS